MFKHSASTEYIEGFKAALQRAAEVADRTRQQGGYDSLTAHVIWLDIRGISIPGGDECSA